MKKILRKREIWFSITAVCVFALVSGYALLSLTRHFNNARVINCLGAVRGDVQKLINEEQHGEADDPLIERINISIDALVNGGTAHGLKTIDDTEFTANMNRIYEYWDRLKSLIYAVRSGAAPSILYTPSLRYFELMNVVSEEAGIIAEKQYRVSVVMLLIAGLLCVVLGLLFSGLVAMQEVRAIKFRQLASIAYQDTLTGLNNRAKFTDVCADINRRIQRSAQALGVVVFDMNYLEKVNSDYGHEMGDLLIKEFAARIKRCANSSNVFRVGGDEFVVIFENSSEEEVSSFAARVSADVADYNAMSDDTLCHIHYACGYEVGAPLGTPEANIGELLKVADRKMFENKRKMNAL